ncbi:hypothetical protein KI387_010997 [Taxus chinensis]|uniref:FAD-binding PCMH-type domain-containing protein n=1 Tax=Taxus chinensis TaxID=29808 RepID=A0AA38FNQ7_TAXCH|nr:hypothetical protein KI387_010997 [Taxus chinensis]
MALWTCVRFISVFVVFSAVTFGDVFVSTETLISCLTRSGVTNVTLRSSSSSSPNYDSLLKFSLQNLRYAESNVLKPYALIIPHSKEHVVKSVQCCIQHRWEMHVRSGGHSYEGLSSTSRNPNFVIIDLMELDGVLVDMRSKTAWVESGATVGQLYSAIADKTARYGFPAGICPTIGVGGHLSGGGLSLLSRKYGLSADNVVNALLVDANGNLVDREGMGPDVFWALRGGGGGSWGVVISWKIKLVKLPPKTTVFNVPYTGRDRINNLLNRWQAVAPSVDENLYIRAFLFGGNPEVKLAFSGMFLGSLPKLLQLVNKTFPEMGLVAANCNETDWIGSMIYTAVSNGYSPELRNRFLSTKSYFKIKSDFVTNPISASGFQGVWKIMEEQSNSIMILAPLGGIMNRIPSTQLPFPHRVGYLYVIQYVLTWNERTKDAQSLSWMQKLYKYTTPYVSKSPRAAYVNYLDLDLGTTPAINGTSTLEQPNSWGYNYFAENFERLVQVKNQFDPNNIFRNAQSIPLSITSTTDSLS